MSEDEVLKAPFIYFGGKRKVASVVWEALGDVANYVEPFAGSLAVLLGRPTTSDSSSWIETVNDADHFLSNFWRALAKDPSAVAEWADWPVNEDDLFARHMWLMTEGRQILAENIHADPDFYDPKTAGWWVWGINAWIGSGWCAGRGPWHVCDGKVAKLGDSDCGCGRGVNRQLPHLGSSGQGVNRQLPHLGDNGKGVNRQLPQADSLSDAFHHPTLGSLDSYFRQLASRLRRVRVCTGDWTRVLTTGALNAGSTVGVFLDPPYSNDVRTSGLYGFDDGDVAADVRRWAIENGDDPSMRIVLAGYLDEHDDEIPKTWRRHSWSANVAYQTSSSGGSGGNAENRHKEVLWFSPYCIRPSEQGSLWGSDND